MCRSSSPRRSPTTGCASPACASGRTAAPSTFRLAPPRDGRQSAVVIALGTVETTRVALTTFQQSLAGRAAQRMGTNLIAHLRSNLTIRVPRAAIAANLPPTRHPQPPVFGAAREGQGAQRPHVPFPDHGGRTEQARRRLRGRALQEDPDARTSARHAARHRRHRRHHDPRHRRHDAAQSRQLHRPLDARDRLRSSEGSRPPRQRQGRRRSNSRAAPRRRTTGRPGTRWTRSPTRSRSSSPGNEPFDILASANSVSSPCAAGTRAQRLAALAAFKDRRDDLGTTHHDAGTMRMGDNVADAVTNDFGRIHDTTNCYVAGPALFPTVGSPNPMLTGVALGRRTGDPAQRAACCRRPIRSSARSPRLVSVRCSTAPQPPSRTGGSPVRPAAACCISTARW